MATGQRVARRVSRAFRAYIDLLEAADWLRGYMSGQLLTFDLNMSEFRLLELLYREGPTYREKIAETFQCAPQVIGRTVDSAVRMGWVQREASSLAPSGGRENKTPRARRSCPKKGKAIVVLSVTTEGKKLIAHVLPKHARVVTALMRVLEAREQDTLSRVCRKLREGDVVKFVKEIRRPDEDEEGPGFD